MVGIDQSPNMGWFVTMVSHAQGWGLSGLAQRIGRKPDTVRKYSVSDDVPLCVMKSIAFELLCEGLGVDPNQVVDDLVREAYKPDLKKSDIDSFVTQVIKKEV